jgi:hypothetical protein
MSILEYLHIPNTASRPWQIGTLFGIIFLMVIYFLIAFWYKQKYGQFRSTKESINNLLAIRRHDLGTAIDTLTRTDASVCKMILNKAKPYDTLTDNSIAIVNYRPLTVRLAGYLGGIYGARDGVFDMTKGITLALNQGARAFVFEIDYLEDTPCEPVLIHRDSMGYMRSLHTGSIKEACNTLVNYAFEHNYDPVMIILYFRRIPSGLGQQSRFFKGVASSLNPLSTYHLGLNEQGNFHYCRSESQIFTSRITNFQKKFIILCNYNTNLITRTPNPKDNLDFWVNARLYQDPLGKSSSIGNVTTAPPNGQPVYAQIGSTTQLLNIGSANNLEYLNQTSSIFTIALSDVEYSFTINEMDKLLNTLGIHCVPIDVVRLSAQPEYLGTKEIARGKDPTLEDLSISKNSKDVLSFWTYYGWSRKPIIMPRSTESSLPVQGGGTMEVRQIPGFIMPTSVVPNKPSRATDSNGGRIEISG